MYATLQRSGGVEAIARRLSVPTPTADRLVCALLPDVLGGLRRALNRDIDPTAAVMDLEDVLLAHGGGRLAAAVIGHLPFDAANFPVDLTAHVLGDAAQVESVIARACDETDHDAARVTLALDLVTMLAAGYLAARLASIETIDDTVIAEINRLIAEESLPRRD